MDHPAPAPDSLVRPWRTAAIVACAIAAVELVLLLAAGAVLLGRTLFPSAEAAAPKKERAAAKAPPAARRETPAPPRPEPIGRPELTRRQTTVIVLNGNGVPGAAGSAARRVAARGYTIRFVGNARRADYPRSVVMYRPGFRAEAFRLGHDLGVRLVSPLDGLRPRELHGAKLALVIGR